MFSNDRDGIILELESFDDYELEGALFLNCAFMSSFGNEDERLFIGGYRRLKFYSLRVCTSGEWNDYRHFIAALSAFGKVVKGERLWNNDRFSAQQKLIIRKLIQHKLGLKDNHFTAYINSLFHAFCDAKDVIKIDLRFVNKFYKHFARDFLCDMKGKNKTLLRYAFIARVFPKCTRIVTVRHEGCYVICVATSAYFGLLLEMLEQLNESRLQCVKVVNVKLLGHSVLKFQQKYNDRGWCIHKVREERYLEKTVNVLTIAKI